MCCFYFDANGIEGDGEYKVYALSGKTDRQLELQNMIANDPEKHREVVCMFDRLSRDRYDSVTYMKVLRECGAHVILASEEVEDTPEEACKCACWSYCPSTT